MNQTRRLIIPHQPKTAGTFASECLPGGFVRPHCQNFHFLMKNNLIKKTDYLGCIIRDPLDYYISLITFWCLDEKWVASGRMKEILSVNEKDRLSEYQRLLKKQMPQTHLRTFREVRTNHPLFLISKGFTLKSVNEILDHFFDEKFIEEASQIISRNHHTYDYKVFGQMKRLDIGYYTFAFLDQHASKKINEIQCREECFDIIQKIKNDFIVFNNKNISQELEAFCRENDIPFRMHKTRSMKSNRKEASLYNFSNEIISKIKEKDGVFFNEL